jgi:hypothetical protein
MTDNTSVTYKSTTATTPTGIHDTFAAGKKVNQQTHDVFVTCSTMRSRELECTIFMPQVR